MAKADCNRLEEMHADCVFAVYLSAETDPDLCKTSAVKPCLHLKHVENDVHVFTLPIWAAVVLIAIKL